jgi:ribulose-5-phosphate 4-epimerase/fuculose-1-phosphate aldolase
VSDTKAREEICRVGRSLFERGYVHATAGNVSIRLPDGGFLITPTDACLGFLDPARLSRLDAELKHVDGDTPSKTIALHSAIYSAATIGDPRTSCVIHTHSTHCVALSLAPRDSELIPPITPYFVMKVGHVPVIRYCRPGSPEAAREVVAAIKRYADAGTPIRAVMLTRLGPNVWHDTPAAAMATLEELEETAKLWCLAERNATPLGAAEIDELRKTFNARW